MKKSLQPQLGQIELLDPKRLRLFVHRGMLSLETERAVYLKIMVTRAFPLSMPSQYIGFLTGDGRDIGLIKDPTGLTPETRRLLDEALEKRYFAPKVTVIRRIEREHGHLAWSVDTDMGERDFWVQDFRENLLSSIGGNCLVTDVDGNRYDLGRLTHLDPRSRAILDRWI